MCTAVAEEEAPLARLREEGRRAVVGRPVAVQAQDRWLAAAAERDARVTALSFAYRELLRDWAQD